MNSSIFTHAGQDIANLQQNKADKYELHSTNNRVDSLEHSLREARAEIVGLRDELQMLQSSITQITYSLADRGISV